MSPKHSGALLGAMVALVFAAPAQAQYNPYAGRSAPRAAAPVAVRQADGTVRVEQREVAPARDSYGNAAGTQYDLAVDGAFDGETVAVLHFYTGETFDFRLPQEALRQKGFSVYRWINQPPAPAVLREQLRRASQLWVISNSDRRLNEEHLNVINEFFQQGHGVYIWGDNEPYYADANAVAQRLFNGSMSGNLIGDRVVPLQREGRGSGVVRDHLITTGLEQLYEGITIATIAPNPALRPLVYGSANNLVTAYYDQQGRRAILDGGFTRLYNRWDTAGTARYVKNAAAWLANAERFGTPNAPSARPGAPSTQAPAVAPQFPVVTPPAMNAPRSELRAPVNNGRVGYERVGGWLAVAFGVVAIARGASRKDDREA